MNCCVKGLQVRFTKLQRRISARAKFLSVLITHLIAAGQHQSSAAGCVSVRWLHVRVPAHFVSPVQRITSLLVELEPLLAAAIGHPAVQRHVAVVGLC